MQVLFYFRAGSEVTLLKEIGLNAGQMRFSTVQSTCILFLFVCFLIDMRIPYEPIFLMERVILLSFFLLVFKNFIIN